MITMTTPARSRLGNYLAEYIELHNTNAESVAQEAKVSVGTVRNAISGRTQAPDVSTLLKLSKVVGLPFETVCRMAVDLPEPAQEPIGETDPAKAELLAIYEALPLERRRKAVAGLREILGHGPTD